MPQRKIAEAMITAGIPFAEPEQGGPCLNSYTPGFLRDRGIIGKAGIGMPAFEKKVIETHERQIAGHVTFFFQRTTEAENFIKAWDETAESIKRHRAYEELSDAERKTTDAPRPLPDISAEVVAQVLCIHAANTENRRKLMFVNAPICDTLTGNFEQGETKGGAKECATGLAIGEATGGGKIWSTDLPNVSADPTKPDRAKLKLHNRIK